MCWISDGRISGRWTLGLTERGGVRHASTSSSLSTVRGTNVPTSNRSVDPSSTPRPNHRPQGNLQAFGTHFKINKSLQICQILIFTCMCDRILHFELECVLPSIWLMVQNYRGQCEALSKFPGSCATKWVHWTLITKYAYDLGRMEKITWKTNSRELRGMVTCWVSHNVPEMATQTLAVVVTGPYFFDGNITTRYGNSD